MNHFQHLPSIVARSLVSGGTPRNKYYADVFDDPELKDILEMRKAGSYIPINEERVKRLRDQNGTEVEFEELVINGRTTGFVRCTSLRCQTMMMQKIRKQVCRLFVNDHLVIDRS